MVFPSSGPFGPVTARSSRHDILQKTYSEAFDRVDGLVL